MAMYTAKQLLNSPNRGYNQAAVPSVEPAALRPGVPRRANIWVYIIFKHTYRIHTYRYQVCELKMSVLVDLNEDCFLGLFWYFHEISVFFRFLGLFQYFLEFRYLKINTEINLNNSPLK